MSLAIDFSPLTELEAVNGMLMSIGLAPVNSLAVSGVRDIALAQYTLHTVSREVQTRGWWFNREFDYHILPDGNNNIPVAPNILAINCTTPGRNLVWRGTRMYDADAHTFTITDTDLTFDVRWFLEFDELPQSARSYIARRAGRLFQSQVVGSEILYQFTVDSETQALNELRRDEQSAIAQRIGEVPTTLREAIALLYLSVTPEAVLDEAAIRHLILSVSRECQQRGWWFNRETGYKFTPTNNEIVVPDNVIQLDPVDRCKQYVVRGTKLYDTENHTFTITEAVECNVIWNLPFEELPQSARNYIVRAAGVELQSKFTKSQIAHAYTMEAAMLARAEMLREDLRAQDSNFFTTDTRTNRITNRLW